ncbi:hypothetical protein DPMN_107107 [Dreissena polymorpha]|uniref:Uncharacterized protein n=1 Tax=Dreissena polymorpha TaxID=45954 RepID=A0A9D4QJL3_DREPO|nr:hypothetical protein DPMN_107107 [Dreissena polymorpha]
MHPMLQASVLSTLMPIYPYRVSEARRQQLKDLEGRMATLHKQLTDQKKLLKLKEQKEKDALKMNTEIQVQYMA